MKQYLPIICFINCVFIFSTPVSAQADSIDVFIRARMQERKIPGLQLAIVQHGKIVKAANYGYANVQDSIPVNERTVFPVNSITKAFTGVAIMQLVEAGKLNLSSPVSLYLSGLPKAWNSITVLQLLSHTSGIPDINEEMPGDDAWEKVVLLPMDFTAGERFSYNQVNYLLLGRIIDTLSGMSFTQFIIKEQLLKTGMVTTIKAGFGAAKQVIAHAAGGYRYENGRLVNMFFSMPPSLQTAAGMSSTANEIANWIIALQSDRLLQKRSTLNLLWTPAKLNNGNTAGFSGLLNGYAAGWPIATRAEHPAAAAVGGARSSVFVYPGDDLSIIVLTNLAGASPEEFTDELAGFYIPAMKESNGFGLSPSVKLLRDVLERSGYPKAIDEVKRITASKGDFILAENEINSWGYKLLRQKRSLDALEIFKLNVFLFPSSSNVFDSLGEIYAELGDRKLATRNYERSLQLDPGNDNAREQLKRLKGEK